MADLIDRAALLKALRSGIYTQDMSTTIALGLLDELLRDAPTVDAAPVVHAYWIQHNAGPLKSECSACRTTFNARMEYDGLTTKHCPCCGASMDADAPERAGKERENG